MLLDIFVIVCLALGCFFALTGALGILRMPDFFSRLHPAGKTDSAGLSLIALGLLGEVVKYETYGWLVAAKLVLIVLFVLITGPAAAHAIAKSALLAGVKPWTRESGIGNGESEVGNGPDSRSPNTDSRKEEPDA
jgi:multicomponent Na+:H+ antiporter subunit G